MRIRTLVSVLAMLLCFHWSPAQCPADTLLWEDFQSQQIPGSWPNLDLDSLTDRNNRPSNWFIVNDPISSSPSTTNYVAASNSWFSPAGTSDNWLITGPVVVCDTNLFLVWKSAPFEGPVYMDGYEVLLSDTTNDPANFTVNLETFAEGIGATAQASAGTVHTEYEGNRGLLQSWRVPLDAWLGDTVYFAFRHRSTDDNLIQLDDIGVVRLPQYDAAVTRVSYSTGYPIVPLSQVRPMQFEVEVENQGVDTIGKITVDMLASLNSQPAFTATDSVFDLAPLENTVLGPANSYTPAQVGTYQFQATAVDSSDGFLANNLGSLSFAVSDSVYARDEGPAVGYRSLGANSGFMGQTFTVFVADTLSSISFYLDQPIGQDTLRGAIYSFANSTPGILIAQTDPWPVPSGFSGWAHLGLEGIDLPLAPGFYLVGLEESSAGELNLGWTESKYSPGAVWHRVETVWASADALDLPGAYMVRANFGEVDEVVAADPAFTVTDFSISPNPGSGLFQLEFAAPLKGKAEIVVRDLQGKILLQKTLAGGLRSASIDLREQPGGMYLLSIGDRVAGRLMW